MSTTSITVLGSDLLADQFSGPVRQLRTINGKSYLRIHRRCPIDGNSYWEVTGQNDGNRDDDQRKDRPMLFHSGRTPAELFRLRANPVQGAGVIRAPADADFQNELKRLVDAGFPHVAKLLERELAVERFEENLPGQLFALGSNIRVANAVPDALHVGNDELDLYLSRFQSGDFGTLGRLSDVQPSEDRAWAPCLFGMLTENWATIVSKPQSGLVRSEYALGRRGDQKRGDDTLAIWTLLCPGRPPKTFVFSPSRNSNI